MIPLTGLLNRRARHTGEIVAALDMGSRKVCCLIGTLEPAYGDGGETSARLTVLGLGHQRSQGIVAGAVADLGQASAAVAAAVSQAEQAAGVRIGGAVLGIASGDPRSRTFNGHVDLPAGVVGDTDIARLDAGARAFAARDGTALLSLNRIAYGLDTAPAVTEPLGLAGQRLYANHHAVTVAQGALRNHCLLMDACQLVPALVLPAGFASALAATTTAERHAGVVCIDIGAETASIAAFADGHFVHTATIPIGGQHATEELARALALPLAQAERIKTLYGSLAQSAVEEHQTVPLSAASDGRVDGAAVTRADVGRIVAGSMRVLLEQAAARLGECRHARLRSACLVLTGGGSELIGLEGFAAAVLGRPTRVAGPPRLDGAAGRLSGVAPSPAFSCVVGLAMAVAEPSAWIVAREPRAPQRQGYLGRLEQWLRESF